MGARRLFFQLLALELVLATLVLALVASRGPGAARYALAAAWGLGLMAVLSSASYLLLDWGRGRGQKAFMASLMGTLLGKFIIVGVVVVLVALRRWLPAGGFVAGLFGAWVLFAVPLILCLHRSAPRPGQDEDFRGQTLE